MVLNLVQDGNAFCGTVRNISHDSSTNLTFITFTGSIVKAIIDNQKEYYKPLAVAILNGKRSLMIQVDTY